MDESRLKKMLTDLQSGEVTIDQALGELKNLPFETTESAMIDHHRQLRCGFPEVIFAEGKTPAQVADIFERLAKVSPRVLATRANQQSAEAVLEKISDAKYCELSRTISLVREEINPVGHVAIVAAGTSDLPVALEAKTTAEIMGARCTTHFDCGVAGIHRLFAHADDIQNANVVVAIAGMEGALASVVGGLVSVPVIAVPTSVGYGASFSGLAALLAMLNSCASGISVVNIDNGFAGGYNSALINRLACGQK